MSDDEEVYSDEEEEESEEEEVRKPQPKVEAEGGDGDFLKIREEKKKSEFDDQLKEYIAEWRKQRAREEEELKKLKAHQATRVVQRADEEKRLAAAKRSEEERRRKEEEDKKLAEIEAKRKRLEEAERKRQALMKATQDEAKKSPNFVIKKKHEQFADDDPRKEIGKTKEQLAQEKKIALSFRIKPLNIDGLNSEALHSKAQELWDMIIKLETEKYDLEERQKRQDYDLKELKERQKQQLRHKAMKKGLDPEALTGKHPPKVRMYSKFERQVDRRTFVDKKGLYDGGWEVYYTEINEKFWKENYDEYMGKTKAKLPKWFGERPGKKKDDPETPEDEVKEEEELEPPPIEEIMEEPPEEEEEEIEEEEEEEEEDEEEEEEEEEE